MTIKYCAPFLDYSGYGECSRHHIGAFDAAGVEVIGELLSYQSEKADYSTLGPLMHKVADKKGDYKIKLMHTTPDEFERLIEPGKYHVGFCYWETDKIPQAFADGLNLVDEIWTGSQVNFDAIRNAGISKPIYVFPEPIETARTWPKPYVITNDDEPFEGFLFYSIFEWTDRKNPEALIQAYLEEFTAIEGAGLLIKTYFRNFSFTNKREIRNKIEMIKNAMDKKDFPPIFLYLDLMDRTQIMRIHSTGDCFVSAHRGEGWGIPQVEAMLAGNPVISTNYGGVHEYLTEKSAYLLPYKLQPLSGMLHSQRFYSSDQNWADVEIADIRKTMRDVFDHRRRAKNKAAAAKKVVTDRFNFKRVGNEMANRLAKIERGL